MEWTDERWATLEGGYRVPFDPRPLLLRLRSEPHSERLWDELVAELYHQGDVGEASYAVVPELARLVPELSPQPWPLVSLVEWVDSALGVGTNPPLADWLAPSYFEAIETIALRCLRDLAGTTSEWESTAMLSLVARWKGLRVYARAIGHYSEDELKDFLPD